MAPDDKRDGPSAGELAAPFTSLILPDVATVAVLAQILGRSESQIRALLRSGQIPGRKIGGRWIVSRRALLASLTAESSEAPDHPPMRRLDGGRDA